MDQLPELESDADVDALMARVRAKLAPAAPPQSSAPAPERTGNALRDFLAVQHEYASALCQALQAIATTLEEFDDAAPTVSRVNAAKRKTAR